MSLPPRFGITNYADVVIEVPNLLDKNSIEELIQYANDTESSGLHRRGSKDPGTRASFYTCLVYRHDHTIYKQLNYVWEDYAKKLDSDISIIEPYEIKKYVTGDAFDEHHDDCANQDTKRKINLIIQLTDSSMYEGGDLFIGDYCASRTIGTGIFFPANVYHHVTEIKKGTRYSLIGHSWGPY